MKKSIIIFFLKIFCLNIYSQNITGKIVDAITKQPLPYAYVINTSKNKGVLSDEKGGFKLQEVSKNDTIAFSLLGYEKKAYTIIKNELNVIELEPIDYKLPIIEVKPISKSRILYEDKQNKSNSTYNRKKGEGFQLLRYVNTNCPLCRISTISFFIKNFSSNDSKIRLQLYSKNKQTGLPDTVLLRKSIIKHLSKKNTWVDIALNDEFITIPDGGIFIGMEFISNDEALSIGLTNKQAGLETYMKYMGDVWYKADFLNTNPKECFNLMVKLAVFE